MDATDAIGARQKEDDEALRALHLSQLLTRRDIRRYTTMERYTDVMPTYALRVSMKYEIRKKHACILTRGTIGRVQCRQHRFREKRNSGLEPIVRTHKKRHALMTYAYAHVCERV